MTEHEEVDRAEQSNFEYQRISKSLDPLISTFSTFTSEEELATMIERMFEYLDVDASGSISYEEMQEGLERLPMDPALQFTFEDYQEFTRGLAFTDERQNISKGKFIECMLMEMKGYAFRNAAHQMEQARKHEDKDIYSFLTSKVCVCLILVLNVGWLVVVLVVVRERVQCYSALLCCVCVCPC